MRIPKAEYKIFETLTPSFPRPKVPKTLPLRPVASPVCQPPSLTILSSKVMFLATPRIRAIACCVVLSRPLLIFFGPVESVRPLPSAPVTGIPSLFAATISTDRFLWLVDNSSLKMGSLSRSAAGNGVRSRMVEMTVLGLRRLTNACSASSEVEG